MDEIFKTKVEIFPLDDECLAVIHTKLKDDLVLISDHINLVGKPLKDIGFIAITDIYVDENGNKVSSDKGIVVAGLKEGVIPNQAELEILKSSGVMAYSYSLVEQVLAAASTGAKVFVRGFIPKIPSGFFILGLQAGLKVSLDKLDLGIIYSKENLFWAGVFTKNRSRAISVSKNQELLGNEVRALIVNSGNANACTGELGEKNNERMKAALAKKLNINSSEILSASTGKIGVQLDVEKIERVVSGLELSQGILSNGSSINSFNDFENILNFSKAILTTDTKTKIYQTSYKGSSILGFSKGSGMIAPNMATMFGFLITDFRILGLNETDAMKAFQDSLSEVNEKTFNSISIDSDTSTNDMVILASSMKGAEISLDKFKELLLECCQELTQKILMDGEGATKLVELKIYNTVSDDEAKLIGKSIIDSPLVKTAIFGNDPNWGRIIMALGKSSLETINISKVDLSILGEKVFSSGVPLEFNRNDLSSKMKRHRKIIIDLNLDNTKVHQNPRVFWGTDLSYEYVSINAEYFT